MKGERERDVQPSVIMTRQSVAVEELLGRDGQFWGSLQLRPSLLGPTRILVSNNSSLS